MGEEETCMGKELSSEEAEVDSFISPVLRHKGIYLNSVVNPFSFYLKSEYMKNIIQINTSRRVKSTKII